MTTQKIVYNPETGSIEDYDQCIVIIVPEGMDGETLEQELADDLGYHFETQTIVTWEDTLDAFLLALHAEGIDHDTRARIVATVHDALDNND